MRDGKGDGWKEGTERGRRRTDGGTEWGGGGFGRELFLIDLLWSPRPPSHVIIGRIFDCLSLWKGCVTSFTRLLRGDTRAAFSFGDI